MSTHFVGEGNIGSAPDYREFPNGNDEPRRLLRLNVYFDNPIPKKDGEFEDRGGFWAPVELWHRDAEHWKTCTRRACACWSKAAPCATNGRTPTRTSA
jgi:single-strand DNA-binding protein